MQTTNDIYILLKDLPWLEAGTEFIKADTYIRSDKCSYVPNKTGMKHERFAVHEDWIKDEAWFKKKEEPKEWEILSFYYQTKERSMAPLMSTGYYFTGAQMASLEEMLKSSWKIYSVKRLSDGEVFTVGDITMDDDVTPPRIFKPIKKFLILGINAPVMYAQFDEGFGCNDGCFGINGLSKLPPEQPKLYTQKDLEDAFNEGRSTKSLQMNDSSTIPSYKQVYPYRYPTFQDYLNSKE